MRGLIFLGLLACVHGLGDTRPYANLNAELWTTAAFATGDWAADKCGTGTKQSPIDILTTSSIDKIDVGPVMSTGYEVDAPMKWLMNGISGTATSPTAIEVTSDHPAFIMGGPLDQRLVHLKIIFTFVVLTYICSAISSPTLSSTGQLPLPGWEASIQWMGRRHPWRCMLSITKHIAR